MFIYYAFVSVVGGVFQSEILVSRKFESHQQPLILLCNSLCTSSVENYLAASRLAEITHVKIIWQGDTPPTGGCRFCQTFKLKCIPAKTHPNFQMLSPLWVCLFWCFCSTRSVQKGINKRTCVPYFLLQPIPSTR